MSTIIRGNDYKVEFVEGHDETAAQLQQDLIAKLEKDGWEWAGFTTASRAVAVQHPEMRTQFVGAATETAGTFLYFKRLRTDLTTVTPGEAAMLRPHPPRALRRQAAREGARLGRRVN